MQALIDGMEQMNRGMKLGLIFILTLVFFAICRGFVYEKMVASRRHPKRAATVMTALFLFLEALLLTVFFIDALAAQIVTLVVLWFVWLMLVLVIAELNKPRNTRARG